MADTSFICWGLVSAMFDTVAEAWGVESLILHRFVLMLWDKGLEPHILPPLCTTAVVGMNSERKSTTDRLPRLPRLPRTSQKNQEMLYPKP